MIKCQKQIKATQVFEILAHAHKTSLCLALRDSMKSSKKVEVPMGEEFYFVNSGSRMPPNADLYASPCRHSFLCEVLTREQMPAQLDRFTCHQSQGGTCSVAKTNVSGKV